MILSKLNIYIVESLSIIDIRCDTRNKAKSIARWLKKRLANERVDNVKVFRQSRIMLRKPTVFDSIQRGYEKAK